MAGLIDASIIKPELANSFATGYQKAGEARQTSELKQFQLDELKRDRDSMLQLQSQLKAAGQDPDLNKVFDVMYRSGKPDLMLKAIEGKQRLNQIQQAETMLIGLFGGPAPAVNAMAPAAASGMPFASAPEASPGTPVPPRVMPQGNALTPAGSGIPENRMWNAAPMDAGQTAQFQQRAAAGDPEAQALLQTYQQRPANAMAPAAAPVNRRDITTWSTADLTKFVVSSANNPYLKGVSDLAANELKQRGETKTVAPGGTLFKNGQPVYTAPESTPNEARLMQMYGFPPTKEGFLAFRDAYRQNRLLTKDEQAQKVEVAVASRAPPPPVAVVGPDGKQVYVDRPSAIGKTPASAEKPLTPLQQQKRLKDRSVDNATVRAAQTTAFELNKLADELVGSEDGKSAPHPGLKGITGWWGLAPNVNFPNTDAARAAQKLESFKGKIAAFGRQLASQEGKLGNMAVQEWKIVAASVEKIDPSAGNLDEQMRNVVRQAKEFATRNKENFDLAYEDMTKPENAPADGSWKDL